MSEEKKEYLDKDGVKEFKNLINKQFTNEIDEVKAEVNNNTNAIREINDNLSSEISRAKEADEILKSRVDAITSLSEGSTTGDAELQDIRVKADGTTATSAGNAVREQISELKSDFSELKSDINSRSDMFIKYTAMFEDELIKKYGTVQGIPSNTSNTSMLTLNKLIEVDDGDTFLILNNKGASPYVTFYDSNKEIINEFWNTKGGYIFEYVIPSGAYIKYVKFSYSKNKVVAIYKKTKDVKREVIEREVIEVGYNKEFTKLTDAISYAYEKGNVTINVIGGTYDIIDELSSQMNPDSFSYDVYGPKIGRGMIINFTHDSNVICDYSGTNQIIKKFFSPFNTVSSSGVGTDGDFEINGLNLHCKNVRYCIHDEMGGQWNKYKHKIKNCNLYIDNRETSDLWGPHQTIGGGLGVRGEIEIENCISVSEGIGNAPTISYHNCSEQQAYSKVRVSNSYLNSTVGAISLGTATRKTEFILNGNSFGYKPTISTGDGQIENVEILAYNNEIRSNQEEN